MSVFLRSHLSRTHITLRGDLQILIYRTDPDPFTVLQSTREEEMFPINDLNFVFCGIATVAATVGYAFTRKQEAEM